MIKCNCCGRENSNYAIYCEGCGSLLSTVSDSTDVKTEVDTSSIDTEPASQETEQVSGPAYEPVQEGPVESGNYSMPPEYSYNPNPANPSGMEFDSMCIAGFHLLCIRIVLLRFTRSRRIDPVYHRIGTYRFQW